MTLSPGSIVLTEQRMREVTAQISASVFADTWEAALVAALVQLEAVHRETPVPYEAYGRIEALRKADEQTFTSRIRERERKLGIDTD